MSRGAEIAAQLMANPDMAEQLADELYDSTLSFPDEAVVEPYAGLNRLERDSAVWQKIEVYLTARLEAMREFNDQSLTGLETAKIRGKIETVKEILGLGQGPIPGENPEAPDLGY